MQVTAIVCLALLIPASGKGFLGTAPDATAEVALEKQYNIQIHDVFAKQEGESDEVVKQVKANKLLSALQISTAPDAAAEVALEKQYNIQIHDDFAKQEGESVQIEKQVKANKELSAMQTSLLQTEDDDVATEEDAEEDKALEQDDDASNVDDEEAVEEDEDESEEAPSLLQADDDDEDETENEDVEDGEADIDESADEEADSLLEVSTAPDAAAEVALEKQYNIQIHDDFAKQEGESDEVVKQVKANKLLSALQISTAPDAAAGINNAKHTITPSCIVKARRVIFQTRRHCFFVQQLFSSNS